LILFGSDVVRVEEGGGRWRKIKEENKTNRDSIV